MKKIIILCLLLPTIALYSQDFYPAKHEFLINGIPTRITPEHELFRQRNFLLGVQWGAESRKIAEALLIKQKDGNNPDDPDKVQDSCDIFVSLSSKSHCVGAEVLNARAIYFEPTLALDSLNPTKLVKRYGDTTNPVFGFLYRRGEIPSNPADPNYNRLILQDTSLKGQLVLSNPWPDNGLKMSGFQYHTKDTLPEHEVLDNYLCRKLYLSINLKALDNLFPNDTILKIELPYTLNTGATGLINFASVPSTQPDSLSQFPNGRGYYRKTDTVNTFTKAIYITRNMLLQNDSNITISAVLNLKKDDRQLYLSNYYLPNDVNNTEVINHLGINVTYVGRTAVAIDWIKLETPSARAFLSGEYDEELVQDVQNLLDTYTASQWASRGIRPFRLVGWVEGGMHHWAAQRYYHKLIGNITIKEECPYYPEHYEYYVNPADMWYNTGSISSRAYNPFCRPQNSSIDAFIRTMGLNSGYTGLIPGTPRFEPTVQDTVYSIMKGTDPAKENYETFISYQTWDLLRPTYFLDHPDSISIYQQVLSYASNGWHISAMGMLENISYTRFFDPNVMAFQYLDKNWWGQLFTMASIDSTYIDLEPDLTSYYGRIVPMVSSDLRFFTSEEYKALAWMNLIAGAKGLLYDGVETNPFYVNKLQFYDGYCNAPAVKNRIESLPDEEFITCDEAGPDYIRLNNEVLYLNDRIISLDSMAMDMGRPADKVYIGRKSVRWEVYKLHKYIRQVEPTLMNLRLQAHYMKGFREWKNQRHEYYPLDIFYDFVEVSGVRTKAYYNDQFEGTPQYNYRDSSFYDISLLSDLSVDSNMTKVFYLGVLNRRTNPLVMEDDTLQFYPTYEWDRNVRHGGERLWGQSEDSVYWQDKFWRRMGCRYIRIPFQYRRGTNNPSTKLRVVELGFDDPTVKSWNWRQPEYYI